MAYNGSGVFARLYNWVTDRNNSVKIRADRMDAEMDGFATGLSTAICRDGQSTVTADIPFNNQKITGLGDAAADTDALNRQTADARYDFTNFTGESDIDDDDVIPFHDDSAAAKRKITYAELKADLVAESVAGVASFNTRTGDVEPAASDYDADQVDFTPAGNIAATDVQAAIEELDSEKEPANADILKADESDNLTAGYTATPAAGGTVTTGTVTPDPANGNFLDYVNNGAHTLAAPTASGSYTMIVDIVNDSSAGAVTLSGFDAEDGDDFDTTDNSAFRCYISKGTAGVHINVKKLA